MEVSSQSSIDAGESKESDLHINNASPPKIMKRNSLASFISMDFEVAVPIASRDYLFNEELRFKAHLDVSNCDDQERRTLVSEDEENLFYKVPRRILTYIDSCPSIISELLIDYDTDEERISLSVSSNPLAAKRFTVEVPFERIVKFMEGDGISKDKYSAELYGILDRHKLIIRAISGYVKRNLQLAEYDVALVD